MVDGSDEDRIDGVDVLDHADGIDFNTDNEEEVASDHEDEYYEWVQTEGFRNELRNNPEFARYVGVQWHSPRDRTTVRDVTNCSGGGD